MVGPNTSKKISSLLLGECVDDEKCSIHLATSSNLFGWPEAINRK